MSGKVRPVILDKVKAVAKTRLRERLGMPDLPETGAVDARWSVISTTHDMYIQPNDGLVGVAIDAAQAARTITLNDLADRCQGLDAVWTRTWPGEHYRFLAGLVQTLNPAVVVEVGTFKGQGALALAAGNEKTKVVTYDILEWETFEDAALRPDDFAPAGQLEQRIGDLGDAVYRATQLDLLRSADVIFIDGPKDDVWEQYAVPAILADLTDRRRLIVFDDVRLMAMVTLWRDLDYPKLDVTSFGHWSGTGLLWTA